LIVIDTASERALELGYGANLERISDATGLLTGVRLNLPESAGVSSSGTLKALVALDLYPIYEGALEAVSE